MKTIVINTSKEAQNTKLDILFKAPFDGTSLLWLEGDLPGLGEQTQNIRQSLLKNADTVDRDYQLIVLVDLYVFPLGNYSDVAGVYRMLLEKYIHCMLLEPLRRECNLPPREVALFFVDSATGASPLDMTALAANPEAQRLQQLEKDKANEKSPRKTVSKPAPARLGEEAGLMKIFGWWEGMQIPDFTWTVKCSVTDDAVLDFSKVFQATADSVAASSKDADVLGLALGQIQQPVKYVDVHSVTFWVSREDEQSRLEDFFGVFVNIFTCVQQGKLFLTSEKPGREEIKKLLLNALKKYKYFSREENVQVKYHLIERIYKQREKICAKQVKAARNNSKFKEKTDEQVADEIMGKTVAPEESSDVKVTGLDKTFRRLTQRVFGNYDTKVIQEQNNEIMKSCLKGLWDWRDGQTSKTFEEVVDTVMQDPDVLKDADKDEDLKRDVIAFLEEDHEARLDALIEQVTDAEHKLASNENILLETKELMLKYGDWMRKGRIYAISCVGAVLTVLATVFPFFYMDVTTGNTGVGMQVSLLLLLALFAGLYGVAAAIYAAYIHRKKRELVNGMQALLDRSEQERKASIIALYRYYNQTVVEAESYCLLWRELQRRDRENARKGIKRNSHIKRMKNLAGEVERFITLLRLDVTAEERSITTGEEKEWQTMCLDAEASCYDRKNRQVYCFLPQCEDNQ